MQNYKERTDPNPVPDYYTAVRKLKIVHVYVDRTVIRFEADN